MIHLELWKSSQPDGADGGEFGNTTREGHFNERRNSHCDLYGLPEGRANGVCGRGDGHCRPGALAAIATRAAKAAGVEGKWAGVK
jgi:hypothetical protein